MNIKDLTSRFFSPAKCFACGKLLPLFEEAVICPSCEAELREKMMQKCDVCGEPVSDCHCARKTLYSRSCCKQVRLVNYDPARRDLAVNRLIYSMKENASPSLYDALVALLEPSLLRAVFQEMSEHRIENVVVTYVPRSRYAVRKFGFDQAKLLAMAVAKRLDVTFVTLVKRKLYRSLQMKTLNFVKRFQSTSETFVYAGKEPIPEGTLILICDDVITTGASVAALIDTLPRSETERFIAVSIGCTIREE